MIDGHGSPFFPSFEVWKMATFKFVLAPDEGTHTHTQKVGNEFRTTIYHPGDTMSVDVDLNAVLNTNDKPQSKSRFRPSL